MFNALRSLTAATAIATACCVAHAGAISLNFNSLASAVAGTPINAGYSFTQIPLEVSAWTFSNFLAFDDSRSEEVTNPEDGSTKTITVDRGRNSGIRSVFVRNNDQAEPSAIRFGSTGLLLTSLVFDYGIGTTDPLNVIFTDKNGKSVGLPVLPNDCFVWNTEELEPYKSCRTGTNPSGAAAQFVLPATLDPIITSIQFDIGGSRYFTLDNLKLNYTDSNTGGGGTVPEPASLALTLAALLGAGAVTRRRRAD